MRRSVMKLGVIGLPIALVGLLAFMGCEGNPDEMTEPGARRPADIEARLMDLDGKPYQLKFESGHAMVISFWATWCGPCVHELPSLNHFAQIEAKKGVRVVAITSESADTVRNFLAHNKNKFTSITFLLDPEWALGRRWDVNAFPTNLLIDKQGNLAGALVGGREWDREPTFTETEKSLGVR